jgi:D-glycero-D-manno-heptose 1,7-bisphosphate phosphatase
VVAVFLDRDGVINAKAAEGRYVERWSDFRFEPGAESALVTLVAAGAHLFVVTNQRGVSRGIVAAADLADIHDRMSTLLRARGAPLEGIYACTHGEGECDCRKPGIGLLLAAQADNPWISFERSHLIGDSLNDLAAGFRIGSHLWLVGPEDRRRRVAAAAAASGIPLDGEAGSLAELVRDGPLLRAIRASAGSASTPLRDVAKL